MNKVLSKKGISLVALVITIIVLVVLTGAVVITGVNVPQQGQLAVFKSNVSSIQDAVTLKMLNNMVDKISSRNDNVKWIGVASGYTEESIANPPTFGTKINGVDVVALDASLKNEMQIKDEEFAKYYVDAKGTVYHTGFTYDGVTYYNANTTAEEQEGTEKTLASIAITGTFKIEYIEGEKFDKTGMVVTATYSDESTEDVANRCTFIPTLDTELAKTDTVVTIKYGGKTATVNIIVEEDGLNEEGTTLGSIVKNGNAYGTAVTGYTAGGVSDWSVFYEEGNYVYLIASNVLTEAQIPTIPEATKGAYNGYGILKWSSAPAVQEMRSNSIFKAQWSNYAANINGKCVSALLNTDNWTAFATPSDTTLTNKVVGAIGSPTAEMFAASWSAKNTTALLTMTNKNSSGTESTNGYYYNYNGSIAEDHSGLTTTENELYFPKYNGNTTYYWLASPSALNAYFLCGVDSDGSVSDGYSGNANIGVRPVVCLKSDIPATVTANGIDI